MNMYSANDGFVSRVSHFLSNFERANLDIFLSHGDVKRLSEREKSSVNSVVEFERVRVSLLEERLRVHVVLSQGCRLPREIRSLQRSLISDEMWKLELKSEH